MCVELQRDLAWEDQQLAIGSLVTARWAHCGYNYKAKGIILRLERDKAEVRLLAPIGHSKERPGFQVLSIPRYSNPMEWRTTRCLRLEKE